MNDELFCIRCGKKGLNIIQLTKICGDCRLNESNIKELQRTKLKIEGLQRKVRFLEQEISGSQISDKTSEVKHGN